MAKASTKWLPLFKSYISHLKIQSKHAAEDLDGTGIALDMWTSQTLVLEQICDGIENGVHVFYILKSRQLGVTTITLAILLFWLALHPNTIGCLVSDSDKNAAKNRETIRRYLASLAPFMGKTFSAIKDNRYGFVFSNGSRLDLLVAGKSKVNWGEGEGYTVGHLCVAPDTPVIVADGRVKPIEDIKVGDLVMTHTGAPTRVVDVVGQPNHKGPMMRITPWLGQGVTCSPDHTIPTQRGVIEAGDIRKGDFVVMPIPEITSEVFEVRLPETSAARAIMRVDETGRYSKTGTIIREREPWVNTVSAGSGAIVPLTEEFGFAIGYYLAEGTVIWQPGNIRPCGITFTRHRCEKSYADRAIAALLPYTTGTRRTVDRADSLTSQETIGGSSLARWIATTFGCGDDKIIPDDVFLWGEVFCRGLITGLLTGDGSKKEAFAQGYATNTMVLPSTRASLALQARDLVAALGLGWGAIRYEEGGDRYGRNCKPIWRAMWFGSAAGSLREMIGLPIQPGGHKAGEKYRISGGLVYLKIRKIEDGIEVPYMWDISVEHSDHTFRTPFMSIGNTEVASYGKEEGLESFRHAMAPDNPRSLYLFEGTAKGPNHWKDMWEAAKEDVYSSRCIFVGWWSNNLQRIKRSDRRFQAFGTLPPTPEENEKITAVKRLYEYDITMEQLAWYRWEATRPNASSSDLDQNQPWIDTDAFIQSGVSFFQQKLITNRREEITSAPPVGVEDGGYGYKAYSFYLADEYHLSKVEAITTAVDPSSIKLRVWEHPHPDGLYIIGVDPAGGRSEDSNAHCLDRATEILTRDGWKTYDRIALGDEAVCFDVTTGSYSYGPVERIIIKDVSEPLYHFEGRGVDILATAEHRMVHRYRWRANEDPKLTEWGFGTAVELATLDRNYIHVPAARAPSGDGIERLSLDMCRMIGWVVTDGHIRGTVGAYDGDGSRRGQKSVRRFVTVGQSVETVKNGVNVADEMERVFRQNFPLALIKRRPMSGGRSDALIVRIGARQGAEQIVRWFDQEGRISRTLITETSQEQLSHLFNGILEGDGSWSSADNRWTKVCPGYDADFADDVQEIAIRLGLSATINRNNWNQGQPGHDQYLVHLSERDHRRIRFTGTVLYEGQVWCVTVPTGAFVARRNGTAFVTGNCCSVWRAFADKMVQVAEWADSVPDTRHCAWVTAYLAGQYQNCRINIDLTGGVGSAVMQAFDDLKTRMRSELYQAEINRYATLERRNREMERPNDPKAPNGMFNFEDFLTASSWYLYRRIDAPGPGYSYNTKLGRDLKWRTMNMMRDSWVTNVVEIRSVPLLDEMVNIVQTKADIGAAAVGRQRDDRTFAMSLANFTWLENLRGGLISQGITWEGSRAKESGEISPIADTLNRRIYGILRAADEMQDLPPPKSFYEHRGL